MNAQVDDPQGFYVSVFQELFDRCENKRRTLFKLASETEDNDSSLGERTLTDKDDPGIGCVWRGVVRASDEKSFLL